MRTDEHIPLNMHFSGIRIRSFVSPIKMGNNGSIDPDGRVVFNGDGLRMRLIEIDVLTDPNILADVSAAQAMKKRPDRESSRYGVCQSTKESLQQLRHPHLLLANG
jgi:hypothetical protein